MRTTCIASGAQVAARTRVALTPSSREEIGTAPMSYVVCSRGQSRRYQRLLKLSAGNGATVVVEAVEAEGEGTTEAVGGVEEAREEATAEVAAALIVVVGGLAPTALVMVEMEVRDGVTVVELDVERVSA